MKTLILFALLLAVPLILASVIFFIVASLLPQKILRVNPSRNAPLYDHIASWEEEQFTV